MLRCYYDIGYSARFNELFGELYIGKHPTREQVKYMILYFNFSMIQGRGDHLEADFNRYMNQMTTAEKVLFDLGYQYLNNPEILVT